MKKLLALFIALLFTVTAVFSQDFGSEAEDLAVLETRSVKNDFAIGFNLSLLGVEPTFQWIHNDHFEMETGISFIQYNYDISSNNPLGLFLITPMVDAGYRTQSSLSNFNFSIGGTLAIPVALSDSSISIASVLAIYVKFTKNLGIFELGGKTYVPLYACAVSPTQTPVFQSQLVFADKYCIACGLLFTTFEVKIHIR